MLNGKPAIPQFQGPSVTIIADQRTCTADNPNGIQIITNLQGNAGKWGICQLLADGMSQWAIRTMNLEKSGLQFSSTMVLPDGSPAPLNGKPTADLAEKLAERQTQLPPTDEHQ